MKVNDYVRIKGMPKGDINEFARVLCIYPDGRVWIANGNMPFSGTISKIVKPEEIEVVK